jgi:hypothetical protein
VDTCSMRWPSTCNFRTHSCALHSCVERRNPATNMCYVVALLLLFKLVHFLYGQRSYGASKTTRILYVRPSLKPAQISPHLKNCLSNVRCPPPKFCNARRSARRDGPHPPQRAGVQCAEPPSRGLPRHHNAWLVPEVRLLIVVAAHAGSRPHLPGRDAGEARILRVRQTPKL